MEEKTPCDTPELKRCPLCKGKAYVRFLRLSGTYKVECIECGLNTRVFTERADVVTFWNDRPMEMEE